MVLRASARNRTGKPSSIRMPPCLVGFSLRNTANALQPRYRRKWRGFGSESVSRKFEQAAQARNLEQLYLETIRAGKNGMTCLALFAVEKNFHVACYHEGMEPFMARGRELRAQGVKDANVDSVRFAEVKSGKIVMPKMAVTIGWHPCVLSTTGHNRDVTLDIGPHLSH